MPTLVLYHGQVDFQIGTDYSKNPMYVGHISYDIDEDNEKSVIVGYLQVSEMKQGSGYGKVLLNLMLLDLHNMKLNIGTICLDDCSDCAMTKKSIYFKQGFRIHDRKDHAKMSIELSDAPSEVPFIYEGNVDAISQPIFKTIPDIIMQNVSETVRGTIVADSFKKFKIVKIDNTNNIDYTFDVKKAQKILHSIINGTSSCKRITRSMNSKNAMESKIPRK